MEHYIPELRLWMEDLNRQDDEHLKSALSIRAALLILKHIVSGDLERVLVELLPLWREMAQTDSGLGTLATIFRYVVAKGKHVKKDHLHQIIKQVCMEDVTMGTIAEVEGEIKGKVAGKLEHARQSVLQVLEVRFSLPSWDASTALAAIAEQLTQIEDIERLDVLREAVRTASVEALREHMGPI